MFSPSSRIPSSSRFPDAIRQSPDLLPQPFAEAIARHDHDAVQQLLSDRDIPSKILVNVLARACEKKCPSAIKNDLIRHPAFEAQYEAALGLARKYNDPDLVRQLNDLLTYARRKSSLYPTGASTDKDTPLDRALREGRRDDAEGFLKEGMQDRTVRQAWRGAVRDNQLDILRAILLLGYADQDRGFQMLQKGAIQDTGIAAVMKESPYFSPKRGLPLQLNNKAKFTDKAENIVCRHLVMHQQEVQASDPHLKFDYRRFQDLATISTHVKPNIETKYLAVKAQATETHLINNKQFGQFLVTQFNAMASNNQTTRQVVVVSTNHAMNLSLRIKNKEGMKSHVVRFFDPNRTTGSVRSKASSLKTFEAQALGSYLDGHGLLNDYYPEGNGASMMYIRLSAHTRKARSLRVVDNKMLTSCIKDNEINAATIFQLLDGGFAGDLRRLEGEIARRPVAERIELLAAKIADGTPGLFVAIQDGHADEVRAYGELLRHIPEHRRAELFTAKRGNDIPGLAMALYRGHGEAIEAYGEGLRQVPEKDRAELLAARNAKGIPGLFMALLAGTADAIKAYGTLLRHVNEKDRGRLIAAQAPNGMSGLFLALVNGHADAIKAYGELLQQVPENERARLLAAKSVSRLHVPSPNSHSDAVKAYEEALQQVPESAGAGPLGAKETNGIPALAMGLLVGKADAIKAYGALLQQVPDEDRVELLAAKTADGTPGLFLALQNGRADAVEAYGVLLRLVPENERAGLLAAKAPDETSGLGIALQEGHADAVKAYGDLLQQAPENERVGLLGAKTDKGISELTGAMKKGRVEAMEQYIEVIKKMAPGLNTSARAALLKDIRDSHAIYYPKLGAWINRDFYNRLKKEQPEFYARFKATKGMLKT